MTKQESLSSLRETSSALYNNIRGIIPCSFGGIILLEEYGGGRVRRVGHSSRALRVVSKPCPSRQASSLVN